MNLLETYEEALVIYQSVKEGSMTVKNAQKKLAELAQRSGHAIDSSADHLDTLANDGYYSSSEEFDSSEC